MGQDIHAFIVHERDRDFAQVRLGRDHLLFRLLRGDPGVPQVVPPPRGLPEHLSHAVLSAHLDTQSADHTRRPAATAAQALTARFMNTRYGRYEAERVRVITHPPLAKRSNRTAVGRVAVPGRNSRVALANPDLHSIGWLTLPELERVAEAYRTTPDYGVFTAAWLEGHGPGRRGQGWAYWRFYPQGAGPHLEQIPWWGPETGVPGPVVSDPDELYRLMLYGAIGGGPAHERVIADALAAEGSVTLTRWGARNGVRGPHARLEATIAAMGALHDPRLVFSFDN